MSTEPNITYGHNGIEIVYSEGENKWVFTLRGRERKVDSLKAAREAIDKPAPKEKEPFVRFKAWAKDGWSEATFSVVEVTSIADSDGPPTRRGFWTVDANGNRSKNYALYPCGPHNDALIKQYEAMQLDIRTKRQQSEELLKKLTPAVRAK